MPRAKAEPKSEAADLSPEAIGDACVGVVNKYAKPNINARTMMSMPAFWADIAKALRGEAVVPPEETVPTLASLNPNEAEVGSEDVTLSVTGTGFTATSVIVWNGGDEPTTFVSATELTTIVKPSTASGAFTIPVSVRNDQVYTDPLDFTFTAAPEADTTDEDEDDKPKRGKRKWG